MTELKREEGYSETTASDSIASPNRRMFLKGVAGASAAVTLVNRVAWANGEIGYWAKDLPND